MEARIGRHYLERGGLQHPPPLFFLLLFLFTVVRKENVWKMFARALRGRARCEDGKRNLPRISCDLVDSVKESTPVTHARTMSNSPRVHAAFREVRKCGD